MLTFIHLTDTHLIAPGERLYDLDPQARLEAAVASIAARHGPGSACPAAFAVITGDLTHHGEPAAYHALGAALDRLPFPAHLMIGNHDSRGNFRSAFPDTPTADGFVQYAIPTDQGRLLLLDTHTPDGHHGQLCEGRLAWLSAELARDSGRVLLFMHHNPLLLGVPSMDAYTIRERDPLWQVLKPHASRVRHIFFGHLHRPVFGSWHGIPFGTIRATSHQVALDFAATGRTPGSHEPPAYAVVRVTEDSVVIHVHDFLDASGTFNL
jgi:3',5'-cyclic AMP phosphodiesterase CpdA